MGLDFNAGIIHWRRIREILERESFHGRRIQWREGRGIICRVFTVVGADDDVLAVAKALGMPNP